MGPFGLDDGVFWSTAKAWLHERGELFVEAYHPHSGVGGHFFLVACTEHLEALVHQMGPNTVIFVSRTDHLPVRGVVTAPYVERCLATVPDGEWWILVCPSVFPAALDPVAEGDSHAALLEAIHPLRGEELWFGANHEFPDKYWEPNDDPYALIGRTP